MYNIAILGAGRVGATLGAGLAGAGHSITFGVRDPNAARAKWRGPEVASAGLADATRGAAIAINATPGDKSVEILSSLRAELKGKILVDVANAMVRDANGIPTTLLYPHSSLVEALQTALPETFVVKTLNTVLFAVMCKPGILSSPATVFLSGNDHNSKAAVRTLLHDLGWPDPSIEDSGTVDSGRGTEALLLLVPYLMRSRKLVPFALTVVR